jgi:argininosuccinate lyase
MKIEKLWGGRFQEMPTETTVNFLSGRDVRGIPPSDEALIPYDLWGSRAHVLMLCRRSILSKTDGRKILAGLQEVEKLHARGKFRLDPSREDVHTHTESFLIDRLGIEYGGKIHTGRSRNDQIVLDMRLFLRDQALDYAEELIALVDTLLKQAEAHRLTVMPGYTHHQHATVTTFGHLLLSFAEALDRDIQRFFHWFSLFNRNPLGAAAGYGTCFNLDRRLTARLLGFDSPSGNVTDPITQRWEPEADLAFASAAMMDHLSTMAQTLMLFSTNEFGLVRLSDRHCSGSSIMPQKRNPDTLEVIKGKTSFIHGMLVSLLSVGKSLFIGYNRDTQWTKYWIMDLIAESKPAIPIMREIIELLQVNEGRMLELARKEFLGATPLMEWLTDRCGVPLRKAKMAMEKAVRYSEEEGRETISRDSFIKALREMKMDLPANVREVEAVQKPERILSHLRSFGMPSERRIRENIASLRRGVKRHRTGLAERKRRIQEARDLVTKMEMELGVR